MGFACGEMLRFRGGRTASVSSHRDLDCDLHKDKTAMRPALLRRVLIASNRHAGQRRLKATAAAQRADELLADFDALEQKASPRGLGLGGGRNKKGKKVARDAETESELGAPARSSRPEIKYRTDMAAKSMERMAFFAGEDPEMAIGEGEIEAAEDVPGIEVGRVVELRR